MKIRLSRKVLIPFLGLPLALLGAAPAQAQWTTLSGGDPVQFDHVCHDGVAWDWGHVQIARTTYDLGRRLGVDWKSYTLNYEATHVKNDYDAHLTVPLYATAGEQKDLPDTATPFAVVSTAMPYAPTYIAYDDSADANNGVPQIHLAFGHLTQRFTSTFLQTGSSLWASPSWPVTVHDCYLFAGVKAVSTTPSTTTVALLGSFWLLAHTLNPATFRLHPANPTLGSYLPPIASVVRDVNGDGLPDLQMTFRGVSVPTLLHPLALTGLTNGVNDPDGDHILNGPVPMKIALRPAG